MGIRGAIGGAGGAMANIGQQGMQQEMRKELSGLDEKRAMRIEEHRRNLDKGRFAQEETPSGGILQRDTLTNKVDVLASGGKQPDGFTLSPGQRRYDASGKEIAAVPDGAGGSGGKAPADVQTAEWMTSVGIAKTPEEAWNKVRMARMDPTRAVSEIAQGMAKEQEARFVQPDDPEYKSYQDMVREAQEIVRGITESYTGGPTSAPKREGQQEPAGMTVASPMEGARQAPDGNWYVQKDGRYYRVEK